MSPIVSTWVATAVAAVSMQFLLGAVLSAHPPGLVPTLALGLLAQFATGALAGWWYTRQRANEPAFGELWRCLVAAMPVPLLLSASSAVLSLTAGAGVVAVAVHVLAAVLLAAAGAITAQRCTPTVSGPRPGSGSGWGSGWGSGSGQTGY